MLFPYTILSVFLFFIPMFLIRGQDPYFSQFYANRLYFNPAWAGVDGNKKISLNYRNQWPSVNSAYVNYSAAYDQFIEPMHAGAGLLLSADNQGNGMITSLGISAIYSYHLYASANLTINGGLQVSYVQRKLDTHNFIYGDMLLPDGSVLPSGSENYGIYRSTYPDFAVGFTGFFRNFYSGIALYHLFRPVHTMSYDPDTRLSRKLTFFAGSLIPIYERRLGKEFLQLSPNIIYIKQNKFSQLNYGLETHFKNLFVAGLWLRQNLGIKFGSIIFSGGYLSGKFGIRYSYDKHLTEPSVNIPSSGAHEISLILMPDLRKKFTHRAIKCPKI